jgi:hypothetical protein
MGKRDGWMDERAGRRGEGGDEWMEDGVRELEGKQEPVSKISSKMWGGLK